MNNNSNVLTKAKSKIKELESDLSDSERIGKMKDIYASSVEAAFESHDADFICKYIAFLDEHNNSKAAYEIADRLNHLLQNCPSDFQSQNIADLNLSFAIVCENLSEFKKAQDCFSKALELYLKCEKNESEDIKAKTAQCYLKFGLFHTYQCGCSDAALYITKATQIFEELAARNPSEYNARLSQSLNGLGQFYVSIRHQSKAESSLKRAEEINKSLPNTEESRACTAETLRLLGGIYSLNDRNINENNRLFEAKEICEKLAELDSEKYKPYLARIYSGIGSDYNKKGEYDLAKDYLTKSAEILKPFADSANGRYNSLLTFVYAELADCFLQCDDKETAENIFKTAVEASEKFIDNQYPKYSVVLGGVYLSFGASCLMKKERKRAEKYLKRAAEIFEPLSKMYPEQFTSALASSYANYALAVNGISLIKKMKYLNKAIKLAKTQPDDPVCKTLLEEFNAK